MKKWIYTLLMSSLVLINYSCESFLDEKPVEYGTLDYYNTQEGIDACVVSVYQKYRWPVGGERWLAYAQFGTDIFMQGTSGSLGNGFSNYEGGHLNPSTSLIKDLWTNFYVAISAANTGLYYLPDMSADEDWKALRTAELRFLRALYYFDLVQQYGAIPMPVEPIFSVVSYVPRTPVSDVYKQLVEDLTYAYEHLPQVVPASDLGRASKGAAAHLLAKVYLARASAVTDDRGKQPDDLQKAIEYAEKVINSNVYELEKDFSSIFNIENKACKEIIYTVNFTKTLALNGEGNQTHMHFLAGYENYPGLIRSIEYGRPWTRIRPTIYAVTDLFDAPNDSRLYKTFQWVWLCNTPTKPVYWKEVTDGSGNVIWSPPAGLSGKPKFQVGDTALVVAPVRLKLSGNEEKIFYASKPYEYKPVEKYANNLWPSIVKTMDPTRPDLMEPAGQRNWNVFRLAETYLIAAEAYGRSGNYSKAAEYINVLRRRAAYKEGETRYNIWSIDLGSEVLKHSTEEALLVTPAELQKDFVDFILDERARELMGEENRWAELVRCEKLIDRVKKYNTQNASKNIQPYHKLRPIPQEHIDRLDPPGVLEQEQNPGYF